MRRQKIVGRIILFLGLASLGHTEDFSLQYFLAKASTKEYEPSKKEKTELLSRMNEMLEKTQDAWKDEFTNRFFEVMRVLKHEGKMHNYKLRRLAEEQLAERKRDLEELEYCVMLFSKPETHGDVHL